MVVCYLERTLGDSHSAVCNADSVHDSLGRCISTRVRRVLIIRHFDVDYIRVSVDGRDVNRCHVTGFTRIDRELSHSVHLDALWLQARTVRLHLSIIITRTC